MITEESFESTHADELAGFLGRHFIYTYDNGWQYEMYLKNARTIDYRIHSGMVGGRWVRDQAAHIARLSDDICKVSWDEPTGTAVSVTANFAERRLHGVIFFPRWVADAPHKTVCYQNDHLDRMRALRDAGPTYPKLVIDEFARLTFIETRAVDDESVIAEAPDQLPAGYADRRN
ncbi:phenolic acid decarboxylase [Salinisphaera sp. T5B8]|uniref:phenolic acid decarboxylase n=1 Tax=Salinisphaera sp. T5B8 TaxID=1304154 RepID=UPI00333F641A